MAWSENRDRLNISGVYLGMSRTAALKSGLAYKCKTVDGKGDIFQCQGKLVKVWFGKDGAFKVKGVDLFYGENPMSDRTWRVFEVLDFKYGQPSKIIRDKSHEIWFYQQHNLIVRVRGAEIPTIWLTRFSLDDGFLKQLMKDE
jgi:hypothetical protein